MQLIEGVNLDFWGSLMKVVGHLCYLGRVLMKLDL